MKVKLFTAICCPDGSFPVGAEADISEKIATGLIAAGYAEAAEPEKPIPDPPIPPATKLIKDGKTITRKAKR